MRKNLCVRLLSIASVIPALLLFGCDQTKVADKDGKPATSETNDGDDKGSVTDDDDAEDGGYLQQANDLFQKAKEAGQTTASNTGEWLSDSVSGAMDATGNAAQDTGDWVSDTFKSLKDNGMTTANNTTEWVQQDIQNMSAFEYKVVPKKLANDPLVNLAEPPLEQRLNKLGSQRWECFAVDDNAFYFKRQSKSYLRNVPVKDLLKFLPMSGGGE